MAEAAQALGKPSVPFILVCADARAPFWGMLSCSTHASRRLAGQLCTHTGGRCKVCQARAVPCIEGCVGCPCSMSGASGCPCSWWRVLKSARTCKEYNLLNRSHAGLQHTLLTVLEFRCIPSRCSAHFVRRVCDNAQPTVNHARVRSLYRQPICLPLRVLL